MAGNTKLNGFDPDRKSVQLERWGGRVTIDIGEWAVSKLRAACYTILPKAPVQRPHGSSDGLDVDYDRDFGKVSVTLSPERTELLIQMVKFFLDQSESGHPEELLFEHQLLRELEETLKEHVEFTDTSNEPGVE